MSLLNKNLNLLPIAYTKFQWRHAHTHHEPTCTQGSLMDSLIPLVRGQAK